MTARAKQAVADAASAPGATTTLIVLAVIIGTVILTFYDKVSGDAYIGVVGGIIGGVLVRAGVASGSAASSAPPPAGD